MSKTTDEMNAWIRGQRTIPTVTTEPEPLPQDVAALNAQIRRMAGRLTDEEKEHAA